MPLIKTTQTPATSENEKWLRIRVRFSQSFDSGCGSGSERTTNPVGVHSGTSDPWPPLLCLHYLLGSCCTISRGRKPTWCFMFHRMRLMSKSDETHSSFLHFATSYSLVGLSTWILHSKKPQMLNSVNMVDNNLHGIGSANASAKIGDTIINVCSS